MRSNIIVIFILFFTGVGVAQDFKTFFHRGDSCAKIRDFNQAISFYNKALFAKPERLINTVEEAIILYQMAYVYTEVSNHKASLETLFKLVEKDCIQQNDSLLCNVYNRIGLNYDFLSKSEQALEYYHKSIEYAASDTAMLGRAYNNIANSYQELGKISEAKKYFQKGLECFEKSNTYDGVLVAYINLGSVDLADKRMASAQQYFENALSIAIEIQDTIYIVISKVYLAEYYMAVENYEKAEELLNWSLSTSKSFNIPKYINESYKRFVNLYEKKKDFKKAFVYMRQYKENSDSLFNIESSKEYAELEARFSIKEKEKENEFLKAKQSLTESKVKSQKNYIYMLVAVVIGGLLLLILLLYQRYKGIKIKKLLELQNKEISKAKAQLEDLNYQYEKLILKYEDKGD